MGRNRQFTAAFARSEAAEILFTMAMVLGILAADVAILMTFLR